MLVGSLFTCLVIIRFESVEFSLISFAVYSLTGCLAGYGLREVVIHLNKES